MLSHITSKVMDIRTGLCLAIVGLGLINTNAQESEFYTAAVVEYAAFELQPEAAEEPAVLLKKNAINHMYFMKQAAAKGVDIIVFPECGMTGINLPSSRQELLRYLTEIPEPGRANPCVDASLNTSQLLKDLSCASRRHKIYSVINLPEVAPCSPQEDGNSSCPHDGVFIYNTNIVFDREGNLIARYRKYNLFVEPGFNIEPTAEHSMFDTDFGVRFGMFICFDLLFHEPGVAMVTKHNLTDIVYSTAWFSELPFITAVQTQAEWAYAMDTNFLAAGYNNPKNKNTGSGIYAGRDGVITSVMAFDEMNQMLVAKVKKKSRASAVSPTKTPGQIRDKREASQSRNSSAEDMGSEEVSESTSQKTFSYESSKSFINYLLQHVRNKGIENPTECNRNNKGDGSNIVKREVLAVNMDEVEVPHNHVANKHQGKYDPHLHLFNTALLNLTNVDDAEDHTGTIFLCHLRLCCKFTFQVQNNNQSETTMTPQEFYRVGVFDGSRTYNYQTCLVMKCAGPDVRSCEYVNSSASYATSRIFNTIMIEGDFKKIGNIKIENSHLVNGSFEEVRTDNNIIMRNKMQIQNFIRVALHVDNLPNQNNKHIGKYGYLSLFQDDLSDYNTALLGMENVNKNLSVCQGNLCCEFYIGTGTRNPPMKNGSLVSSNGYYFRVGVFDGVRNFAGVIKAGLQNCALFVCAGEGLDTCGLLKNQIGGQARREEDSRILETLSGSSNKLVDNGPSNRNVVFDKIEIRGSFDRGNLIMPNTLTARLLPFESDTFVFGLDREQSSNKDTNKTLVVMQTANKSIDDVFAFGVFARNFGKDSDWHKMWYELLLEN